MTLYLSSALLKEIHANGAAAYPEEGAGLLLGHAEGDRREVAAIRRMANAREDAARHHRYLITPQEMLRNEQEAARLGLEVIGVFHSHPDHPNRPSEFDREWALPWYVYVITAVQAGRAVESRCWQLREDRSEFFEVDIRVEEQERSSK
jgi:proteasome lid subunit RPN8/RPN11